MRKVIAAAIISLASATVLAMTMGYGSAQKNDIKLECKEDGVSGRKFTASILSAFGNESFFGKTGFVEDYMGECDADSCFAHKYGADFLPDELHRTLMFDRHTKVFAIVDTGKEVTRGTCKLVK